MVRRKNLAKKRTQARRPRHFRNSDSSGAGDVDEDRAEGGGGGRIDYNDDDGAAEDCWKEDVEKAIIKRRIGRSGRSGGNSGIGSGEEIKMDLLPRR